MGNMGEVFQRVLRERRKALGLSQEELADRLGVAQSYISQMERGASGPPTLDRAHDMARALETSIDYLAGLTEDPSPAGTSIARPSYLDELLRLMRALPAAARDGMISIAAAFVEYEQMRPQLEAIEEAALRRVEALPPATYEAVMDALEEAARTGDTEAARQKLLLLLVPGNQVEQPEQ